LRIEEDILVIIYQALNTASNYKYFGILILLIDEYFKLGMQIVNVDLV